MKDTAERTLECELGPIRPPTEAQSLPIRVTRNCPWNRCKFCRTYKGKRFSLRSTEDIRQNILAVRTIRDSLLDSAGMAKGGSPAEIPDIASDGASGQAVRTVAAWLRAGGANVFLQDADTLCLPPDTLLRVIDDIRSTLPGVTRITTYGRTKTAARRTIPELCRLRDAGLSRIHIGLESGYDPLLAFMDKGATAAEHIRAGRNVVASGISLSLYVVLGLGGVGMSRQHATGTARVINEISPEYVRLRTLAVTTDMPLHGEAESGRFAPATDDAVVEEEKLLIERLDCPTTVVSDHITNLLPEIEGRLPEDRERLLATILRYQSLEPPERRVYRMGRRLGMYHCLDDLNDPGLSGEVEKMMLRLGLDGDGQQDEAVAQALMQRFLRWQGWQVRA